MWDGLDLIRKSLRASLPPIQYSLLMKKKNREGWPTFSPLWYISIILLFYWQMFLLVITRSIRKKL